MNSVSVIVPVYQVEKYIEECLNSVVNQTFSDLEIILVDDGSTDSSGIICDRYAETDSRIRVIHQVNAGLSAARNAGLNVAEGKYILFVDSDDYLEPDAIEKLYAVAEENELEIVLFSGKSFLDPKMNASFFTFNKNEYLRRYCLNLVTDGETYLEHILCRLKEDIVSIYLCFYQKDYLVQGRYRFEPGIIHEDEDFYFYTVLHAKRIMSLSAKFYNRRYRNNSIMTNLDPVKSLEGYGFFFDHLIESIIKEAATSCSGKQAIALRIKYCFIGILSKCASMDRNTFRKIKDRYLSIRKAYTIYGRIDCFPLWIVCYLYTPRMIHRVVKNCSILRSIFWKLVLAADGH